MGWGCDKGFSLSRSRVGSLSEIFALCSLGIGSWDSCVVGERSDDWSETRGAEPRVRNVSSQKIDRMLGSESAKADPVKNGKAKGNFDGAIDTGAGQEIPGEKILRFKDKSAYQRFLKSAPAGVVLDQMDGLQAVRVKDGEWLKSMAKTSEIEVGRTIM